MARTSKAVKIKKWLATGEFDGSEKTIPDVIESGLILDREMGGEVFGHPIFKGADGKFYTVFVEAHVCEVTKDYAWGIIGEGELD